MLQFGIDILLKDRRDLIEGRRIGILANAASVGSFGKHTILILSDNKALNVTALFGPEHGVQAAAQDMEPVDSGRELSHGIPIHSLYGKTIDSLTPTKEMLEEIDVLVVDLQDIGSRYYTYVWTAALCAKACSEFGKDIIICDRPNPIGGTLVEGPGIECGFGSFVGLHSVPIRHGMTIGEIVQLVNDREGHSQNTTIIQIDGWRREMNWPDTGLAWHNPSPNMRSYEAALLYPGMCLIEGTNISEGRGTDTPFEIVGAPYIDYDEIVSAFNDLKLPGVRVGPTSFIPTRQKWALKRCNGVRWIIRDTSEFRPYLTGLAFIWLVNKLYGKSGFEWLKAPYEFVTDKSAIDLLTGSSTFRENIGSLEMDDIEAMTATPKDLLDERASHLLY